MPHFAPASRPAAAAVLVDREKTDTSEHIDGASED